MYKFELLILNNHDRVKSNNIKELIKAIEYLIEKGYNELKFEDKETNVYLEIENYIDLIELMSLYGM